MSGQENYTFPFEKEIHNKNGGFVTPNNKIIFGSHKKIVEKYFGLNSRKLLTKESKQFSMYKRYIKYLENMHQVPAEPAQELFVQYYGYDKIETVREQTITTTKTNAYQFYYNFGVNGFIIKIIDPIILDKDNNFKLLHQDPERIRLLQKDLEYERAIKTKRFYKGKRALETFFN